MDSDTVTVVERIFAAVNAADLEAMKALCADETELWPMLSGLTGEPYRGRSALADWFVEAAETFADIALEPITIAEVGNGTLVACRDRRHERSTGASIEVQWAMALRIREGRLAWCRVVATEAEARAAL